MSKKFSTPRYIRIWKNAYKANSVQLYFNNKKILFFLFVNQCDSKRKNK